jgi:hypothetical protein
MRSKCEPTALTQYRLAPDMLPFTRQVLIACDAAKNGIARLSGERRGPKFDDTETTIAELKERIGKTVAYPAVGSARKAQWDRGTRNHFSGGP